MATELQFEGFAMGTLTKTDNAFLDDKIVLRKAVLDAAKFDELHVLDLFSGEGHIWREMFKTYKMGSYLPIDRSPRQPGTLKLDVNARTVKAFNPDNFNVVDIDTYGDPWELIGQFMRGSKALALFITHGAVAIFGGNITRFLRQASDIPLNWPVPVSNELNFFCGENYLRQQFDERLQLALRIRHNNVHYYGLLLSPNVDLPK